MKKTFTFVIGTLIILAGSFSCKKGENDPFLSLSSRKARVVGDWIVTHEDVTSTDISSNGTTVNVTSVYENDTLIRSTVTKMGNATTTQNDTIGYSYTLSIYKDGTYTQQVVNANQLDIVTIKGTWIFVKKSKINNLKNKEAILLTKTYELISDGGFTNVVNYNELSGSMLVIDQLKSKEMITIVDKSSSNQDGLSSTSSLTKTTFTLK